MQITDILGGSGGRQNMARELGMSETEAQSGAQALLPGILGGFKRRAQARPNGVEGSTGSLASSAAARFSTTCSRRNRRTSAAATTCSERSSAPRT